jgi:hypothetical protein
MEVSYKSSECFDLSLRQKKIIWQKLYIFIKYFYARFKDLTLSDSGINIRIVEERNMSLEGHQSGMCRQHFDQFPCSVLSRFCQELMFFPERQKILKCVSYKLIYCVPLCVP